MFATATGLDSSGGTTYDVFAYNASEQIWNGSSFVNWSDGSYSSYRLSTAQEGTSGRFKSSSALPSGTARYEFRVRSGTLAASSVVWEDTALIDVASSTINSNASIASSNAANAYSAAQQAAAAAQGIVSQLLLNSVSDVYLRWSFNQDVNGMFLRYSFDAANFYDLGSSPNWTPPVYVVRDVSPTKIGDTYYIAFTSGQIDDYTMSIASSTDLVRWTRIVELDYRTRSFDMMVAPDWFTDSDGTRYLVCNSYTGDGGSVLQLIQVPQSIDDWANFDNWPSPTPLTGNFPLNAIDGNINLFNGVYHIVYKNEDTKYVEHATSSSLGSFVVDSSDYGGFGFGHEGPELNLLNDGMTYQLTVDQYVQQGFYYARSTDLVTWSSPTLLNEPSITGHGGMISVSLSGASSSQAQAIEEQVEEIAEGGAGDGDILVNHNTGGTDNLRYTDSDGNGIPADVFAYLSSEYTTNALTATRRGKARTGNDGRWLTPMMLDAEIYTFAFSATGYELATMQQAVN